MLKSILSEIKKANGELLDFEKHHYFLFLSNGVADVYLDEDEEELKVNVELSDGIKILHSEKSVEDILYDGK